MGRIGNLFRCSNRLALVAKLAGWAAAGAVLAHTASVDALERRVHATSCGQRSEDSTAVIAFPDEGVGARDLDPLGQVNLYCPLPEDSHFSKEDVNVLNVHGHLGDGNLPASAIACIGYRAQNGGECGQLAQTAIDGDFTLTPSLEAWGEEETRLDFAYIQVILPGYTTDRSSLRGYFIGN